MSARARADRVEGTVFDIDTFAVHEGPGIRMAVYLKGCPLSCAWCHSPESQNAQPELIYLWGRCVLCGACGAVCTQGVHEVGEGGHALVRDRCVVCGRCVRECPSGALQIVGRRVSAGEIARRAVRMEPFFRHSGGGVTLTGGEVTGQADFAAAVLDACRREGIHTAVETCGACPWDRLEPLVRRSDLVLYDLKLMDDAAHRRWTGASNEPVLANARRLAACDLDVEVRVALIPRITATRANLTALFAFVAEIGLKRVALLPYNPSSSAKYEWLQRPYEVKGRTQSARHLRELARLAERAGLEVRVE